MVLNLKLRNAITVKRYYTIAALLWLQGVFIPIGAILAMDTYPTTLQLCRALVTSTIQVLTYLLAFVKKEGEE